MGGGRLGGGRTEQKGERTHGHGQQCGSMRGLNGNGKNNFQKMTDLGEM